jgi:2-hydroxychromene-2-carboxylate isomerase
MKSIDFWFTIGSTYTFLSVMRLESVSRESGISFNYRPFSVLDIMLEMDNIPFLGKPIKSNYMWRDIERRAEKYGCAAKLPVPFPPERGQYDLANLVAVVGREEGWCDRYLSATYERLYQKGQQVGADPNLGDSLREIGQDPDRVIALAKSTEIVKDFDAATDAARALGIFGAPTFAVDGELFWGDDRLEDAISWRNIARLA